MSLYDTVNSSLASVPVGAAGCQTGAPQTGSAKPTVNDETLIEQLVDDDVAAATNGRTQVGGPSDPINSCGLEGNSGAISDEQSGSSQIEGDYTTSAHVDCLIDGLPDELT